MVKRRAVVGLVALVGVAAAAVFAIVGMPFGNSSPEAFAHSPCTDASCALFSEHLHIDADITNGTRACDILDASATVTVGSVHQVGLCLEDYDANDLEAFELIVVYNGDPSDNDPPVINVATEVANVAPALDDNPDANDGDDATGFKLGGGWDCTALGFTFPSGDDATTPTVADAHIVCNANILTPDKDLAAEPGLLATIEFTASAAGTDVLSYGANSALGFTTTATRSCGSIPAELIGCFGATIDKVPDISLDKSAGAAIAGNTLIFTTTLGGGPGVVNSVGDDLDNSLVFNAGASDPGCAVIVPPGPPALEPDGTNLVLCMGAWAVPGPGPVVAADIPLDLAGKDVTNAASWLPGDPNPGNDSDMVVVPVAPADVSIDKVADAAVYSEGDSITWTVTATSNGPSPASAVVLSDTVDANQSIASASVDVGTCAETGTNAAGIVGQVVTCTSDQVLAPASAIVLTVVADVVGSAGNVCENDASVQWADPLVANVHEEVTCLPPTVRMEKDVDTDAVTINNDVNLFLTDPQVPLVIYELVSNPGNDPDGVGAYEFQLKYDHKVFDIEIADSSWLSNGATRTVDCSSSIFTENYILWGCVSSGPVPAQTSPGVAAIITVWPEADLIYRLTPGQENGVFRVLLDENCELADAYGDPLRLADGSLAPGVLPGGLIEVCSDMGITVRILEGDLNLDCIVDALDQQAIAFRYGAVWGTLYYDPWYDLEPWNKDFDIDIKDLQKVWGRQGSVCDPEGVGTIPPQLPVELP